ncbi:hypothetical protein BD410DRAFT_780450 [Rickenella mellea]|uniref:DnaJ homologue subfamily C member 28 conserved domain-containing protein n=1 Tax=Rickenella mellea TaxID=50990 RepID=A0A4R5XFK4_9AGAM|nr:hypothetical protein BD410DRAFT_780450 [Rickenella mellea]
MLTARTTFNKTGKLSRSSSSLHTPQRIPADSRRKEALRDEKHSSALVGSEKLFADAALEESQEAKGRARQEGRFGKITGRGKPITRISDEGNPFIAREEFLMNRIVQRNGAAPPWVELQRELDTALASFREIVKQSWTRRCMRILSSEHPLPLLARITPAQIASVRDPMWEAHEAGYHNTALAEINSLVRRYNGVAPYPVRRTIYEREPELEKVYSECVDDVLREIDARIKEGGVVRSVSGFTDGEDDRGGGGAGGSARYDSRPGSFWAMVRKWFAKLVT